MTGDSWFTAADLASMGLPGVLRNKNKFSARARAEGWRERRDAAGQLLARKRKGRGGGWEYHYSLLPGPAIAELERRGLITCPQAALASPAVAQVSVAAKSTGPDLADMHDDGPALWNLFDKLPGKAREVARRRLTTMLRVDDIRGAGKPARRAVNLVARESGLPPRTIYRMLDRVRGRPRSDWLPALAPRWTGRQATADIDPAVIDFLKSDWLRPSQPPFEACFQRLQTVAANKGWTLPSKATLFRIIKQIPREISVLRRQGEAALAQMYPAQERDRTHFSAMEAVNADGHKWDVFVKWPDGRVARPVMVAIQDLYSNKILAWRVGPGEGADLVRLAFGDMFAAHGVPAHVWLDNGRAFASKWISGGTPNRFRFKVRQEDPVGMLTILGCKIHWTTPYSGQSKPIERAFRDLCAHIAKHPAFEGAWTGNKPEAKPENYASRAIPLDQFRAVVDAGIAAHNARPGRRTQVCGGTASFDDAFKASIEAGTWPVRRATAAQLRLCMLAAERATPDRRSGAVHLFGNRYWSEALAGLIGERLIARFDPDHLDRPLVICRHDGTHVCDAERIERSGFDDVAAARQHARIRRDYTRSKKALAVAEARLTAGDIAACLPDAPDTARANPKLIGLVRTDSVLPQKRKSREEIEVEFAAAVARLPVPGTFDDFDEPVAKRENAI